MILNNLSKVCIVAILCSVVISCSKKDDAALREKEKKQVELLAEKERKEQYERDLLIAEEQEQELARQKAADMAEAAKALKEKLLKEEEAKQMLADQKESKRLEDIARRQRIQKYAQDDFINTKYKELELIDGRVLKSAKVTAASPIKVSFIHKNGVATVKYDNLPKEISLACKYDKELAGLEKKRLSDVKLERHKAMAAGASDIKVVDENKTRITENSQASSSVSRGSVEPKEPEEELKPKGILSVRVMGMGKLGKKVEIRAKSNVDGTISLDGVYENGRYVTKYYPVNGKESFSIVVSNVKNKYKAHFRGGGKLLDEESSGSKSGLKEFNGL